MGDIRNSVHGINHGIPPIFFQLCNTEFRELPRNFRQFRTEYGSYGSTKNTRNSVLSWFISYRHLAPKFQNSLSAFVLALLPVEWNNDLDSEECILLRGELCKSVSGHIVYRHMLNHNSWLVGTLLQKELVLTGLERWRLHAESILQVA